MKLFDLRYKRRRSYEISRLAPRSLSFAALTTEPFSQRGKKDSTAVSNEQMNDKPRKEQRRENSRVANGVGTLACINLEA